MNARPLRTIKAADNRHLTADEQKDLLAYAESLPRRVRAEELVEKSEAVIVSRVIDQLKGKHPNFPQLHPQGWDGVSRDVQLVLRYDAQAMLFDDVSVLENKVLDWLRTTFQAFNVTPGFVRDTYEALRDACKEKLPAETYRLLEPYLSRNVAVLTDIPEPASAEV